MANMPANDLIEQAAGDWEMLVHRQNDKKTWTRMNHPQDFWLAVDLCCASDIHAGMRMTSTAALTAAGCKLMIAKRTGSTER